nr:unnamed protein product [Digitaria exilis]
MGDEEGKGVVIRRYDPKADRDGTEAVERDCELGPPGAMSLHADLLGDPVARIRHSPLYLMLVAVTGGGRIVGVVRGTVKSVATGERRGTGAPGFANVGYILGLRVAASHRRMGIALMLVQQLERWFEHNGAEYAYIATDKSNKPSLRLFTVRCGYSEFRTPYLLVNPVHSHRLRPPLVFFPADIGDVLANDLSRAACSWRSSTAMATPRRRRPGRWPLASAWDCGGVFRLASRRAAASATRALDRVAKWLRVPSVPDLFRPFAGWFVYGAAAVEVAAQDPLRSGAASRTGPACPATMTCPRQRRGRMGLGHVGPWLLHLRGPQGGVKTLLESECV